MKYLLLPAAGMLLAACTVTQKNKSDIKEPVPVVVQKDTSVKTVQPKPYEQVVTKEAVSSRGLLTVHKINDRYFFEIPDSLLGQDLLVVARIAQSSAGGRILRNADYGYAGDEINKQVIRFEKGPQQKIFIRQYYFNGIFEWAGDSSANGMYRSLAASNLTPIAASFPVKAYTPAKNAVVIDVTDYLNGENGILFFGIVARKAQALEGYQADKSYIESVHSYPLNTEIQTVKTYTYYNDFRTYLLNTSIVLLPKNKMQGRIVDDRVGYFPASYVDLDRDPQKVQTTQMALRWRLEPKQADSSAYKQGKLVEPGKPIVFYIDPTTPAKWIPYLIAGVNAWQPIFEKAGFRHAIYGRVAPTKQEDSTWSLEDARYSALVYKPSAVMNANGPNIHDPRTGEILESHINWYHNVLRLLHNWYFVQTAAVDTGARNMLYDDSLMGRLITFVATHEVGHALGLRHNFGASATVPVDSLRNGKWIDQNGLCPSIMDYARFNYVAQPEDGLTRNQLIQRPGIYDEWAIKWGYRWLPEIKSSEEEQVYLSKWTSQQLTDVRLRFGSELRTNDPRSQAEDLGDDAIKAGKYGIANLKRIITNLKTWTAEPGDNYSNLSEMYKELFGQFKNYLVHVADNIGGCMYTDKAVDQPGPVREYVSRKKQKDAVAFLQEQLFETPGWLLDKEIFSLTEQGSLYKLQALQRSILEKVLRHDVLGNLLWFQAEKPGEAYTVTELLQDMRNGAWKELKTHQPIDFYRRNFQKLYAVCLVDLLNPYYLARPMTWISDFYSFNEFTDVTSVVKAEIKSIIREIRTAIPFYKDELAKQHLTDIAERLEEALEKNKIGRTK